MSPPSGILKQPGAGEPTVPYRRKERDGQAVRPPVALVPATGPVPTGEIQGLLRRRLRIIVLIIAVFYGIQLAHSLLVSFQWIAGPDVDRVVVAFCSLTVTLAAALVVILRSGRSLSLGALRAIELII